MANLDLTVDSGDAFDVRRFTVTESISGLFSVRLWVLSDNPRIDLDFIVGKPASFHIESGAVFAPLGGARHWMGIVSDMELSHAGTGADKSSYHLRIVPTLWLLRLRRNYRIHQDKTIPQIVASMLTEWNIPATWNVDGKNYSTLEYRVQYGESDYDFMCRLLEEAGIAFTFPEAPGDTRVVLADLLHAGAPRGAIPHIGEPNPGEAKEVITAVRPSAHARPGAQTLRDHDFRNPGVALLGEAPKATAPEDKWEQYGYRPGGFVVRKDGATTTPQADDRGIYRHDADAGKALATRTLEALRTGRRSVSFALNTVDLWPGAVFTIGGHPAIPEDLPLLCTEFELEGTPTTTWVQTGHATAADVPYRPPLQTRKPRIVGVHPATVVGPPKSEVFTDEHGRARVQFPWDRHGTRDERSSLWMRVSQGWAGTGYGLMQLPRIGQEVLVAFQDGDPDAPVVVGRVHNVTNPVPYKLPPKKTRSTYRSDSSLGSTGRNEILFEDAAAEELFYHQAERDQRVLVKNDETITDVVNRDKFVVVAETDTTLANRTQVTTLDRIELTDATMTVSAEKCLNKLVGGDEFERIQEDHLSWVGHDAHALIKGEKRDLVGPELHVTVEGCRAQSFGGYSLAAGGDRHVKSGGSYAMESDDETHIKSNTDIVFEAPDITLKGPGGFVRIDASGVTIVGTLVKINAGGSPGSGSGASASAAKLPKEALVDEPKRPPPAEAGLDDGEIPPGPGAVVVVSIKNEGGIKGGCRFIKNGNSHKYTAVGSPEGGSFKWTVAGTISIVGADNLATVEVRGNAVSGALDDSTLTVEYTVSAGNATDSIDITVFDITAIEARLRSTPCRRDGTLSDSNPVQRSTTDSKAFDAATPVVLRGSGDMKLQATVAPAGLPITWDVERAADDAPDLPGPPTHTPDGGSERLTLRTDATGSFHVHAFVDCDGDGHRGADEGGLIFNLHMCNVQILPGAANNRIFKDDGNFNSSIAGGFLQVFSTTVGHVPVSGTDYRDDQFAGHLMAIRVTMLVTGGGAEKRRGVAKVGTGYLQNIIGETSGGTYADGRRLRYVYAANPAQGDPITANPAPLLAFPVRDHRSATSNGATTFINSSTDAERSEPATGGQQRTARMIDSPGNFYDLSHPVAPASALANISGTTDFLAYLVGYTDDFDGTFVAYAKAEWNIEYGSYTAAGGWTNARATVTIRGAMDTAGFPRTAEAERIERCPPAATVAIRRDFR